MQITFWEDEIERIRDGVVYKITNVSVRSRDQIKSETTTRNSAFIEVDDVDLNEIDKNAASQSLDQPVEDTILQVKKMRSVELDKHRSCVHCSAKFPPTIETNIVKCLRCGHRMLFDACQHVVACCMAVPSAEKILTLTCFSEVLENLFEIVDVSALSDDYIAEKLLLLSDIKIAFNDENIVTNIEQIEVCII